MNIAAFKIDTWGCVLLNYSGTTVGRIPFEILDMRKCHRMRV